MARNYQIRCPATAADGETFDAWTARTRMIGNVEAAYEESRIDQELILQAYVSASSLIVPIVGPFPVVMRYDRGGAWRVPYFSLLCCGGTGTPTLRVVLTDTYRRPRTSSAFASMADTIEPYASFTPGSGSTVAWQTEQSITLPAWWAPSIHDEPGGADETGRTFLAWGSVWITTTPAVTYGKVSGVRWRESVVEET